MNAADISVVIPIYNRGDLVRYTMESVRRASAKLAVETIVVDDGSATAVADDLRSASVSLYFGLISPRRGTRETRT